MIGVLFDQRRNLLRINPAHLATIFHGNPSFLYGSSVLHNLISLQKTELSIIVILSYRQDRTRNYAAVSDDRSDEVSVSGSYCCWKVRSS